MTEFDVRPSMPLDIAHAVLEWDDLMFRVWRTRKQIADIIPVLGEVSMTICQRNARRISADLEAQLVSGELLMRLRREFARTHPVVESDAGAEIFRQFHLALVGHLFSGGDDRATTVVEKFTNEARASIWFEEEN